MANDYLVSKWKLWYSSFDVNKDGQVNFEDAEAERYCNLFLQILSGFCKVLINRSWHELHNDLCTSTLYEGILHFEAFASVESDHSNILPGCFVALHPFE